MVMGKMSGHDSLPSRDGDELFIVRRNCSCCFPFEVLVFSVMCRRMDCDGMK